MSLLAEETVVVRVPRARIWEAFADADLLGRILPGCEELIATGEGAFRGVLATRLQFLTLRADVIATFADMALRRTASGSSSTASRAASPAGSGPHPDRARRGRADGTRSTTPSI